MKGDFLMRLKTCGALLALSAFSLFAEEDLSVRQIRKRLVTTNTTEVTLDPLSDKASVDNDKTLSQNTKSTPPANPPCKMEYPQRFQIGGTYSYSWITPKENPTTSGNLGGIQAIYEYRPLGCIYAGAAFNWRAGKTTNHDSSRTLEDFNLQERIGYTLPYPASRFRTTLFTGIGARYMAEKVEVGDSSIHFDYTEFYVPLGFLVERQVNTCFSVGCNFQWMPQIFPIVKIKPLSGARWDLTYEIPNFAVDVPLKISPWKNGQLEFIIDPFFEYWRDGHSTAVTSRGLALNLPSNTYLFAGVNVNLAYSF